MFGNIDNSKKINIMMFGNVGNSKLGKKSNGLMLLKKLEVHYIVLKNNRLMLLDIHIQIKIVI